MKGRLIQPRPPHTCKPPGWFSRMKNKVEIGDKWICDDCQSLWIRSGPSYPGDYDAWVKQTPRPAPRRGPAAGISTKEEAKTLAEQVLEHYAEPGWVKVEWENGKVVRRVWLSKDEVDLIDDGMVTES